MDELFHVCIHESGVRGPLPHPGIVEKRNEERDVGVNSKDGKGPEGGRGAIECGSACFGTHGDLREERVVADAHDVPLDHPRVNANPRA